MLGWPDLVEELSRLGSKGVDLGPLLSQALPAFLERITKPDFEAAVLKIIKAVPIGTHTWPIALKFLIYHFDQPH